MKRLRTVFLLVCMGVCCALICRRLFPGQETDVSTTSGTPASGLGTRQVSGSVPSTSSRPGRTTPAPGAVSSAPGASAAADEFSFLLSDWNLANPECRSNVVSRLRKMCATRHAAARNRAIKEGWHTDRSTGEHASELMAIIDGRVYEFVTHNVDAAISTAADKVRNTPPYNLNGAGFIVGIWDEGLARSTHQEFGDRVTHKDVGTTKSHATRVAGTIGAVGIEYDALGMAPGVTMHSYEWSLDLAELAAAAMAAPDETNVIQVSNHSYGIYVGWTMEFVPPRWYGTWGEGYRESDYFGMYDTSAQAWDALCYNAPYCLPFRSVGNDRDDSMPVPGGPFEYYHTNGWQEAAYDTNTDPHKDNWDGGYDTVPMVAVSKNILSIGAVADAVSGIARSLANASMMSFSCWGPTDDGRVKPDIVANGDNLFSTGSGHDSDYDSMTGTSAAAPNAAGSAVLLVEYYNKLFPNKYMRASTLKGLIVHTADDRGRAGPDYKFGWGLMDTLAAADLIKAHHTRTNAARIVEDRLTTNGVGKTYSVTWDNVSPIRVTLCWTDPPGQIQTGLDNRSTNLVHDLDLRVVDPSGATNFPYVLCVTNPTADAVTADNDVDNVEQVYISSPGVPGDYTVLVMLEGSLTMDEQYFSLLVSGSAVPPEITHTSLENTTNTVDDYIVDAEITCEAPLATNRLYLFWNTTGATNVFTTNALLHVTNDIYRGSIAAQPLGTNVYYYIYAESSNGVCTVNPDHAPGALYSFQVTPPVILTVTGTRLQAGTPIPGYGEQVYASGVTVSAWCDLSTTPTSGCRYLCTGWSGSGSVPASGASNAVSFVIREASTVAWQWQLQYSLLQTSSVAGIVSTTAWFSAGGTGYTAKATASAASEGTNYQFTWWYLDDVRQPDATNMAVNPVTGIAMTTARVANAVYLAETLDVDVDSMGDWWELYHFGTTNRAAGADADSDGRSNLMEYGDRTDPDNKDSWPVPPVVDHVALSDPTETPAPWSISAVVTDNYTVAGVALYWNRNSNGWQNAAMMPSDSAGLYTNMIPAPATNGDQVVYRIEAVDALGLAITNGEHTFHVRYPLADVRPAETQVVLRAGADTNVQVTIGNIGNTNLVWTITLRNPGLADNIESGTNSWTHTGTGDLWHITTNRSWSGSNSWYCGSPDIRTYNNSMDASLVTPSTWIAPAARLTFRHYAKMEYDKDVHYWDAGTVEISTNNGISFSQVTPRGGYPHLVTSNTASPFEPHMPCYAGTGGWQYAEFDLSDYARQTALVRFRFGSDAYTLEEGWYIDDVTISPWSGTSTWLTVSQTNGTVVSATTSNVTVHLDTSPVPTGNDRALVVQIACNDPTSRTNYLPVTMKVRSVPDVALLFAGQTTTGDGYVIVSNSVYDADGEECALTLSFSSDSGATWTSAWVNSVQSGVGSAVVSNEVSPAIMYIATTNIAGSPATNSVSVAWSTTNGPPPIVLCTNIMLRASVWDGNFWSTQAAIGSVLVDNESPGMPGDFACSSHTVGVWSLTSVITLNWTATPGDGQGSGLAGYRLAFTNMAGDTDAWGTTVTNLAASGPALASDSNWWASLCAADNYGNLSSATNIGPFRIDVVPPAYTGAWTIAASGSNYVFGSDIPVAFGGFADEHAGIAGFYVDFTNGAATTNRMYLSNSPATLAGAEIDWLNTVYVWAQDNVGNVSVAVSDQIAVLSVDTDFDGDGQSNYGEHMLGYDPRSATSSFAVADAGVADTNIVLCWPSISGRQYSVWISTDLFDRFMPLPDATNLSPTPPLNAYTTRQDSTGPVYYRIRVE